MSIITRVCHRCKVERPPEDFYLEAEARQGARMGFSKPNKRACRPCNRQEQQRYRAPRQAIVDAAKRASGCMDCGLHPEVLEVLEFDHRPDEVKSFSISQRMSFGTIESLREEITKCDILCANCHRVRTVSRRGTADERTTAGMAHIHRKTLANDIARGRTHVWDKAELPVHHPKVAPGQEALFAA